MKMAGKNDREDAGEVPVRVVDRRRFQHMADPESAEDHGPDAGPADEPAHRRPAYVEELEEQLRASRQRLEETLSAHRRSQAEIDQVRARLDRDFVARVAEAKGRLFLRMLEVADEMERALEASAGEAAGSPLATGLELIRKKLVSVLDDEGLERLELVGQPFDPELAEAIGVVEVDDPAQHDRVVTVLQSGYRLDGKLLRPARVQVGRLEEPD